MMKEKKGWGVGFLLLAAPFFSLAQDSGIPLQAPAYHLLDRLDILGGIAGPLHPEIKAFSRRDAVAFAMAVDSLAEGLGPRDRRDLQYLFDENNEWLGGASPATGGEEDFIRGRIFTDSSRTFYRLETSPPAGRARYRTNERPLFGVFYRTPAHFFEVNTAAFRLKVNPLLNFSVGKERDGDGLLFHNQRGLELRGDVDGRVFFYTSVLETQARFADYVNERVTRYEAVPGALRYKNYRSKLFDTANGYDFNVANAYVGFYATRHVGIQLGHGRHFIGNGYRSVFLSDFGPPAFYLKISARVWRFHYQTLFLELHPASANAARPNQLLPKKYAAVHYLNFKATPRLAFGFFEATVFNRGQQFELQYLNPIILYRTVEAAIGSPDNVLIGVDGRWDLLRRVRLYGQILFDEFRFDAIYKPREKGWWGNKFAWQLGAKYVNAFGADHLDLQVEWNGARPYTWSHRDSLNSWTHYSQPLAHPLWSNFQEVVLLARWQPLPRLDLGARLMLAYRGEDTPAQNWGAEPLRANRDRVRDYGNFIGQGVRNDLTLAGLDASWQLYHNFFLDLNLLWRRQNSLDTGQNVELFLIGGGIRLNVWNQKLDF